MSSDELIARDKAIAESGRYAQLRGEYLDPPLEDPPLEDPPLNGAELVLTCMRNVQPERVCWLWPGYLPAAKLVVLDGDPSVGKSTLAVEFAAVVSTGGRWPDGDICQHLGDVIILSAEDGIADTIRPRLEVAGANLARVHAVEGKRLDDGTLVPPTLEDITALEAAINRTAARLLIVDVLMAYLPLAIDSHRDQDIRRTLARLSALAERTGCAVLLLRHLNKASGRNPLYRGGGSIAIGGAARVVMLAAYDPDDQDRRVLAVIKNNLAPMPPSLTYQLVDSGAYGAARVLWVGQSEHTAASLLDDPDEPGAATEAERWLEDYLNSEGGSAKSSEAKKAAAKVGIAERTLKRAAKSLRLTVESRDFPRVTIWAFSSQLGPTGPTVENTDISAGQTVGPRSGQVSDAGPTTAQLSDQQKQAENSQSGRLGQERQLGDKCPRCGAELTPANLTVTDLCLLCFHRSKSAESHADEETEQP